jgi:hypothetical protein
MKILVTSKVDSVANRIIHLQRLMRKFLLLFLIKGESGFDTRCVTKGKTMANDSINFKGTFDAMIPYVVRAHLAL